jgi:hypothetical protein
MCPVKQKKGRAFDFLEHNRASLDESLYLGRQTVAKADAAHSSILIFPHI